MAAFPQFALLVVCWLGALTTLLIFLESWFALSRRSRLVARRASGAYGVVSIFVPMRGPVSKAERAIQSIFGQSYPFIELLLIYPEDEPHFANLAKKFRNARSHIPVRLVGTTFPMDSSHNRARALEQAYESARGKWFVTLDSNVILDRFAIETALEFAGSNEISALGLRPGVRCGSRLQSILAPSMEHLLQLVRITNRRRDKRGAVDARPSFLLHNRESFDVVNRINRMPGILNEAGWDVWSYQVEGLRTFEGDGSRWMWRDGELRSWSSDTGPELNYSSRSANFVIGSAIIAVITVFGLVFGFIHRAENFAAASIFAFSALSYSLMAISHFLFARRLRAGGWLAPLWFVSYFPAVVLTLSEIRRIVRFRTGKIRNSNFEIRNLP